MNQPSPQIGKLIAWPLRVWFGAEIAFGVAAIATIALAPQSTATNFAWNIQPVVSAALLGAFYVAVASIFIAAILARRWEMVRVIMIPAIVFTFTELLATLLHWDRFLTGNSAFWVWLASYLLPPPILTACYLWHQRQQWSYAGPDSPLPAVMRVPLLILGGVLTLDAIAAFIQPSLWIDAAPWKLTPLTTRALSGWILALGTMMLSVAWENDRDRARMASPFFILLLPAIAVQLSRYAGQVNWSHPRIAINIFALSLTMALGLSLAWGSWRRSMH